jgi:hypothetical protein
MFSLDVCTLLNVSVSENVPIYDILNEFQFGHSHMAIVFRQRIASYQAKQLNNYGENLGELSGSSRCFIIHMSRMYSAMYVT